MKPLAIAVLFAAPIVAQCTRPTMHAVELRITDTKGEPIRTARVELLHVLSGRYCEVLGRAARALVPTDFRGDHARLDDLPSGVFVLRVEADGQATTLSEPFQLPAHTVLGVDVRMQEGAVLEGVVHDGSGNPVVGAIVRTEPGGEIAANAGRLQTCGLSLASTTTLASVRTGADGSFRIPLLASGDYQVIAEHAAYAPTELSLPLAAAEKKKLRPIVLLGGAFITGSVTRNGRRVSGAAVRIFLSATASRPAGQVLSATTDEQGAYSITTRIPTGARCSLCAAGPGDDPFQRLLDTNTTRRTVEVKAAGSQSEDVTLPDI